MRKKDSNKYWKTIELLSKIIAGIDFPEDVKEPEYEYIEEEIKKISSEIDKILVSAKSSNILRQGIKIAILGKPNVGKSSLFNALLQLKRAIVTEIAGTTRDVLTETLELDGIPLTLIDTAGIRETQDIDKVEEIGIEYSKQSAKEADIILFLYDSTQGLQKEDNEILEFIKDKKHIIIANKTDLAPSTNSEHLSLSTVTKEGFETLKDKIKELIKVYDIHIPVISHSAVKEKPIAPVCKETTTGILPVSSLNDIACSLFYEEKLRRSASLLLPILILIFYLLTSA